MTRRATIIAVIAVAAPVWPITATDAATGCNRYHGRDYVVCRESGPNHMPKGLRPGTPHPGPSSATGPCGMLRATRKQFGGDNLAACARYMYARYGTWAKAERFHRRKGWW